MLMALVDRESFVAANTLRQLMIQTAVIVGPAIGGVLLAPVGIDGVYWINAGAFVVTTLAVFTVAPPRRRAGAPRLAGPRSSRGSPSCAAASAAAVQACFAADLDAMILGMPTSLFPALGLSFSRGRAASSACSPRRASAP